MKKVEKVLVFSCMLSMLVMFCLSLPFAHEAAAQTKILKIGLISSVTGPMAPAFKSELDAAKPAEDLLNQTGGITVQGQKYRIEITTADDQSSPPGAVSKSLTTRAGSIAQSWRWSAATVALNASSAPSLFQWVSVRR